MTDKIKKFIERYVKNIENNEWDFLYSICMPWNYLNNAEVSEFTQIMLECNIDPLIHMKEVPSNYLFMYKGNDPLNIDIPNNIEKICHNAFGLSSNINSITIPKSVKYIGQNAFPKNTKIIIPYESLTEFKQNVQLDIDIWTNEYIFISKTGKNLCLRPSSMYETWEPHEDYFTSMKSYIDEMLKAKIEKYKNCTIDYNEWKDTNNINSFLDYTINIDGDHE